MANLKYYTEEEQRIIVAAALLFMSQDKNRTALHMGGVELIQTVDSLYASLRQEGDAVDLASDTTDWLTSEEGREYEPISLEKSGDTLRVNVGELWVNVNRTDEGVVMDIFCAVDDATDDAIESVASTYALFGECAEEGEDDEVNSI